MNLKTTAALVLVAILFFFGVIFAWSAPVADNPAERLIISALMFAVGFGIVYFTFKKPTTVVQQLEVSGQMKAVSLKCPNCSASIDVKNIKIVSGVPYATCPYCGHVFEVAEEPKW
jgi:DNA-directed RNA polymerase subunit RPC12/RpoP